MSYFQPPFAPIIGGTGVANSMPSTITVSGALNFYSDASHNLGFGLGALQNVVPASANSCIAIGDGALNNNFTGVNHIAIGNQALFNSQNDTDGGFPSSLIAIGTQAAFNINDNTGGTVAIGYQALFNAVNTGNTIAIGDYALFNYNTSAGVFAQNVAIGPGALFNLTQVTGDARANVAIGFNAGAGAAPFSGFGNVLVGAGAFQNLAGNRNFGLGTGSGSLTSGSDNVCIGFNALNQDVFGAGGNICIGSDSMGQTIGADNNIAIGIGALFGSFTETFQGNTVIGGGFSMSVLRVGDNNVAIGNNVANGTYSNLSNSVFIGANSTPNVDGLTNAIAIGFNSTVSVSNALILGNGCNVGIGTSSPTAKLQVMGGQIVNVTPVSANYNVLVTDYFIDVLALGGPITITLPASPSVLGTIYIIKDEQGTASVNNITIDGNGATIDGSPTFVMTNNYQSITLIANISATWSIM